MDLNRIIKKVLMEEESRSNRYMFFSNLQQMKRQCEMLLEMDQDEIESILENGHDWAQDHIAEAKNNMDQVFDFLKNETEGESDYEEKEDNDDEEDMVMVEGRKKKRRKKRRKKTGIPLCARGIASAKSKYDVYPSAYANGHAVQVCKGTIKGLDGKKHCSGAYC
jgi:hypothetical protein